MERFAFKTDKRFKSNLNQICRLCGMNTPNKINIHEEVIMLEENELPLIKKIFICIGIRAGKNDKMPQTICALCFDKINDFHEFREMCYATNAQTRKLLGLAEQPKVEPNWNFDPHSNPQQLNGRKRPGEIYPCQPKLIKLESQFVLNEKEIKKEKKKGKKNIPLFNCCVCDNNFCTNELLHSHLIESHVPTIPRYHCTFCNESINTSVEIRNHELWHKLTKTKYKCGRCDKFITNKYTYTKHLKECSKELIALEKILPDIKCKTCSQSFQTNNLFYIHDCITSRLRCPKCSCKLSNQSMTTKHIATCSFKSKLLNGMSVQISNDVKPNIVFLPIVTQENLNKTINIKKENEKTIQRCGELIKNTMQTLVTIKHEPVDHINDNVIQPSPVDVSIKQENIENVVTINVPNTEVSAENETTNSSTTTCDEIHPALKIKIKKEHGTLNSSFIPNMKSTSENITNITTELESLPTIIKQEPEATAMPVIIKQENIKQEVIDDYFESQFNGDNNNIVIKTEKGVNDSETSSSDFPILKISSVVSGADAVGKSMTIANFKTSDSSSLLKISSVSGGILQSPSVSSVNPSEFTMIEIKKEKIDPAYNDNYSNMERDSNSDDIDQQNQVNIISNIKQEMEYNEEYEEIETHQDDYGEDDEGESNEENADFEQEETIEKELVPIQLSNIENVEDNNYSSENDPNKSDYASDAKNSVKEVDENHRKNSETLHENVLEDLPDNTQISSSIETNANSASDCSQENISNDFIITKSNEDIVQKNISNPDLLDENDDKIIEKGSDEKIVVADEIADHRTNEIIASNNKPKNNRLTENLSSYDSDRKTILNENSQADNNAEVADNYMHAIISNSKFQTTNVKDFPVENMQNIARDSELTSRISSNESISDNLPNEKNLIENKSAEDTTVNENFINEGISEYSTDEQLLVRIDQELAEISSEKSLDINTLAESENELNDNCMNEIIPRENEISKMVDASANALTSLNENLDIRLEES